ncbi:MAG: WD40 repeat domain-containing protein [Candidatus Fermentibacteraceae bacterium]|nr:WD40 repeat domain-containing protein [Candidatus Fermentibacteraceae bacterium]
MNRIDPACRHLGDVYGVESEDGFSWHTVLVAEGYVLHFRDDVLIDSLTYEGDIDYIKFSANHRYLLGYSGTDNTMKLFDLIESTVVYQLVFSHDMGLLSEPSFRLADDGRIIAKYSTYLRIYDSDLNVILSSDDFEWGGNYIGMTHDGSRMYSSDDRYLRSFDANAYERWSVDLPESEGVTAWRRFTLSNAGRYLAITDLSKLYLYDAITGRKISEYDFETGLLEPVFSPNDAYIVISTSNYPDDWTPQRNEDGFGMVLVSCTGGIVEQISEFYLLRSNSTFPYLFTKNCVSDSGIALGYLNYSARFTRVALLSDRSVCLWLSGNAAKYSAPPNRAWFLEYQQGISPDGSRLWFFDGQLLHFCIAEGV